MVQSQKAVDDYIIGKLGTKVALKPGEVVVSDPRHLHRGALSRPSQIIDLSDESGRLQYYRLTGQPPSGYGVQADEEGEDSLYNIAAQEAARRQAEYDAGD